MIGGLAGPAAALGAAGLWAAAVILFRRPIEQHGARTINLAKCVLATVLQGATVLAVGQAGAWLEAPSSALWLLVGSGIVGLTFGDTALFAAVGRIGAHRTLLLQTLSPIFTALIAFGWQGELPGLQQTAGALLILAGVAIVIGPPHRARTAMAAGAAAGIALGVLAALGQAAGIVLAKEAMEVVPSMPASVVRLAAASIGLVVLALFAGRTARVRGLLGDRAALGRVVPATFLGTYLAMFLFMAGIALAPAAVAAVLLATSPVFSLFLEAIVERKPITLSGASGTLLAVAGVALLVTG